MTRSLLDSARGTVPGIAWPPLVEGAAATLLVLARQFEASQWFEPEKLQAGQFEQLATLTPWLSAHSRAFARRLNDAGLSAADLGTPEGLAALPPVERRWFQAEPDIYCDVVPPGHEPIGTNVTSGSTGEFLRIRRTRANQLVWLAMVLRDHAWREADFTLPLATVRAPSSGIVPHPDWGPPASLLYETGPALSLPVSLTGDQLFDRLEAFGVGNLLIYPNALRTLIDAAEARGARLASLRAIRTVGERVDPALRQRCSAVLGIDISDAYTCQEAGYLALQCPESDLYHLMAEGALVEVLRPNGTPCVEGETGKVVITDLHNHATPVVRYALGDYAETGGLCPCGRGLPTVRRIVGRSRNLIRMPDGNRVWPSLGGFGPEGYLHVVPIRRFQYIQTDPERLELRLVAERPLTSDEKSLIVERTQRALGHPFRIDIVYFEESLPSSPSEKFEDFICLV
jgi:phenylacetate-CoA ligase